MINIELHDTESVLDSIRKFDTFYIYYSGGGCSLVSRKRFAEIIGRHKEVDVIIKGQAIAYVE